LLIDFDLKIGIRFLYENRIAILRSVCSLDPGMIFQSQIDFSLKNGDRF